MLNALQPWHIIVLVVVLIALFGAKRLPDAASGIGKSMRIFKAEAKTLSDEHEAKGGPQNNAEAPARHLGYATPANGSAQSPAQHSTAKTDTAS